MNLASRNQDPIHASLALSLLLSVWYKPNSRNNKSIYNNLLLVFYICAKPRLTHWSPCPKNKCHYFCTGVNDSQLADTSTTQFMGSKSFVSVADSGAICDSSLFSLEIPVSTKIIDIWRHTNKNQCVPDKPGCSCRTTTRGFRLSRQGCWCWACRSNSPVSYCRILSTRAPGVEFCYNQNRP